MTMSSIELLPLLRELPGDVPSQSRSSREILSDLKEGIPDPLGMGGVSTSESLFSRPYESINSTLDGLTVLSRHLGIPLPDSTLGIQSYTEDIITSLPLICHALDNGNGFNQTDLTTVNQERVVTTLVLMSRMGIDAVLKSVRNSDHGAFNRIASVTGNTVGRTVGGMAGQAAKRGVMWGVGKIAGKVIGTGVGGAVGSFIPGAGNVAGVLAGAAVGATVGEAVDRVVGFFVGKGNSSNGLADYLNQHLQPHMLDLALNITGLTNDDLFYYKNKPRIDDVAVSFHTTAKELAAAPA